MLKALEYPGQEKQAVISSSMKSPFLLAVLILLSSFFVPGGPTGAGWTLYPPQAITSGTPGSSAGIVLMLISLCVFVAGFTMGGLNYIITMLQSRARGMTLMRLPLTCWVFLRQRYLLY